jgi:phosphoribosylglycinamide formyltransferase-1
MPKSRIAVFASGNGTNAEAIFNYFRDHPRVEVALLLSNDPSAFVLERARKSGVSTKVFKRQQFRDSEEVLNWLVQYRISHIALAGFLWLVPQKIIHQFSDRIINIHPALLPKFGGKGMFGMKVHEAIKLAGEKETGITIHLVNEKYDEGTILFKATCPILKEDSPEEIAAKVNRLELTHYPRVIEEWIESVIGNR